MKTAIKSLRLESRDPCARFWHQVRVASAGSALLLLISVAWHVV